MMSSEITIFEAFHRTLSPAPTPHMLPSLLHIVNQADLETPAVLKKLALAHRYLGELKGACASMPNQSILISTLTLQESEHSSAIENIVSTQDALHKYKINPACASAEDKEVHRYAEALVRGHELISTRRTIGLSTVLAVQHALLPDLAGLRTKPGTVIINRRTSEIIYRPPSPAELPPLLEDWEAFIKNDALCQLDVLIKMALLHHQFESIHPFYDGNGRSGRIMNILYLVHQGLLDVPILYLSRYINQTRMNYYRLLQRVREQDLWEEWVLYMLDGVHHTAVSTLALVRDIKDLLQKMKTVMRSEYPKLYSQDLLNNLFKHPYTKIQFVENDLNVSAATAARYLETLVQGGLLKKEKLGRENYYFNDDLIALLFNIPALGHNGEHGTQS